ncbi:hypothetical protein H5410_062313 [Solanum commersonii]|uniref:Glycosylphosphatidylinositol anchor biosynthesis protein 11 n=1 Tax=Solanum commersonii TaxID=4109 RepID=A0A9J5WA21_SOLCO|nr:hypothetical protein H5410_062313 [Solanum commersonii]
MDTLISENGVFLPIPPFQAVRLHFILGTIVVLTSMVAHTLFPINLITHPTQTLFIIWGIVGPVLMILFGHLRQDMEQCSYFRAAGRGYVGLVAGAIVNALGAIILGAPVGFEYFTKTLNWSLLMSSFTFVPAACAFGSAWTHWHRVFASTKAFSFIDYMIRLPAYGAVIGAWFGAWPMPLDWERPWQEWPICVSYGAMAGYLMGLVASSVCIIFRYRCQQHLKGE